MIICKGSGRSGNIFIRNIITFLIYLEFKKDVVYERDYDFNLNLNLESFSIINPKHQNKINDIVKDLCKLKNDSNITYSLINLKNKNLKDETIHLIESYFIKKFNKKYLIFINENFIQDIFERKIKFNRNYIYIYQNIFFQKTKFYNFMLKLILHFNNINNIIVQNLINNNKYKDRYNNNNDIFIHIRAGDIFSNSNLLPTYDYYDKILSNYANDYQNIYLCSDNHKNYIFRNLKKKYKINLIEYGSSDNILFGSTCKYIILSGGSYSFMFGLFGFYSKKIFFNKNHNKIFSNNEKTRWYPDYYSEFLNIGKRKYTKDFTN